MMRDIDRTWDQLVPSDDYDPDYGPVLDVIADAGEAAGLNEPYLTVEVVYPKVQFTVGDLIIEAGSREYDDEPSKGYWANGWDAVTTSPFNNPCAEADTPEALFAAYIPMLVEAGLVKISKGQVVATKRQRERLDAILAHEQRVRGW